MDNDNNAPWFLGSITRESIPAFAVKKTEYGTELNFTISELRQRDKGKNTHTIYCYNKDTKEKVYIGKCRDMTREQGESALPKEDQGFSTPPDGKTDDLPF